MRLCKHRLDTSQKPRVPAGPGQQDSLGTLSVTPLLQKACAGWARVLPRHLERVLGILLRRDSRAACQGTSRIMESHGVCMESAWLRRLWLMRWRSDALLSWPHLAAIGKSGATKPHYMLQYAALLICCPSDCGVLSWDLAMLLLGPIG